ncbi:hypothetical protein GQX74_011101 [Glossina fuscipes]|nr:hypothetical protein GQX74_011101 [Glossina fuscipes]
MLSVRKGLKRLEGGRSVPPEELRYKRAVKTTSNQIQREQRLQDSIRVEGEGFFGFEKGVVDRNIPIIDEVILNLSDMICEVSYDALTKFSRDFCYDDYVVESIHMNPSLQIVANSFLANPVTSPPFATTLVEYLLNKMHEIDIKVERSNLYPRLFKLVFGGFRFIGQQFDISSLIISAKFWPLFNKEMVEFPEEIANEFKKYTKSSAIVH